jgi:hypothetical protein
MTDALFNELRVIRSRIESIEHGQEVLIRAERQAILREILPIFAKDPTMAQVYLLVDGVRGQRQIAQEMARNGLTGASEPTVSRKLVLLCNELDLILLDDRTAAGNVYRKTLLDRALHLTREVQKVLKEPATAK